IGVFPLGATLAAMEMRLPSVARAVPVIMCVVVLIAGALQFAPWKVRQLAHCRMSPSCGGTAQADFGTAWRHGLRLGVHCGYCCANWTAILLVCGVMDLRAMVVVTAAISAERLAPGGERVARATGAVAVAVGVFLIARAVGLV
ncbi:MAG: DUF2182 domain-containing protein, partial [Candidatus Acidiferrales bacterium]